MIRETLAKNIIYQGLSEVQQYLALNPENLDERDEYGFTPLIEAVIFNKTDIVNFLLAANVNVNETSVTGHTALHWSVENYNLELSETLLKHGANPNAYSRASQPILILPLLREQEDLKELLYRYGADLHFAQDYIATKLLAHRYELRGHVDLADNTGKFIELDLEGFFLEFTISIIQHSLSRFKNHYSARHLRAYFYPIQQIIDALNVASRLIRYQHFSINASAYDKEINELLNRPLQLIPLGYEGHAICFIRYKDILVKCDRGAESKKHGTVVIYRMNHPSRFDTTYIKNLLYKKQTRRSIVEILPQELGLVPVTQLPIPAQVTGNCSWANLEAAIPTILFLLFIEKNMPAGSHQILQSKSQAIDIYKSWHAWDKRTTLHEFIINTQKAQGPRKICKAMVLSALLFQTLDYTDIEDVKIGEKILPILMQAELKYILESYMKIFYKIHKTAQGNNLRHLMELCGYSFKQHQ
jgi:hypothetical protein